MKILSTFLLTFFLCFSNLSAQDDWYLTSNFPSPLVLYHVPYPQTPITFTMNLNGNHDTNNCGFRWTITNGKFSNGQTIIETNIFQTSVQVKWDDVIGTGRIQVDVIIPVKKLFAKKIVWKVGDILNLANFIPSNFRKPIIFGYNCTQSYLNDRLFTIDFIIRSLKNRNPSSIIGSSNIIRCNTQSITYTIDKMYLLNVPTDISANPIYADGYEWIIPAGWKYWDNAESTGEARIIRSFDANSISVFPNSCDGGIVKVRAFYDSYNSGVGIVSHSNYREINVTRSTPATNIISINPSNYVARCDDKTQVTFRATAISCATNYNWQIPTG
jgi:hypothetical protein